MSNYIKENHIEFLNVINKSTGEIENKAYREIKSYRRTIHKGAQFMYPNKFKEVMKALKGEKEIDIFYYVIERFSNKKREIPLKQEFIAKKFNTSISYVSKVFKKLLNLEVLLKTSNPPSIKYRLNPYVIIPPFTKIDVAVELQDEWDILLSLPSKIKNKFEYLLYLSSPEWQEIRDEVLLRDNNECTICGSNTDLECHHTTYDNIYHEKLTDLQILCKSCHTNIHK